MTKSREPLPDRLHNTIERRSRITKHYTNAVADMKLLHKQHPRDSRCAQKKDRHHGVRTETRARNSARYADGVYDLAHLNLSRQVKPRARTSPSSFSFSGLHTFFTSAEDLGGSVKEIPRHRDSNPIDELLSALSISCPSRKWRSSRVCRVRLVFFCGKCLIDRVY